MRSQPPAHRAARTASAADGTLTLLRAGGFMLGSGLLAALVLQLFFGGFTRTGAVSSWGWFSLIVALMFVPFGSLVLALGLAKWLRNRSLARRS